MSARAWQGQWSAELEQAWRNGLGGATNPRESIRPTSANRTRRLDADEQEEVRTFASTAPRRRRIFVSAPDAAALQQTATEPPELQVLGEIGAGGMGRVFRARQISLDREVAIKRLQPKEELPNAVEVFESEAAVTAWLDHPNITPVHEIGTDQDGNVFYTMKLIEGTPWDDLLRRRRRGQVAAAEGDKQDLRGHLEILLEVANAVAFAHSKGIIHRDIKPQNVMVGDYGEVLLVDWGLAVSLRPMEHPAGIQDLGQVLITCGTPCYMAPEIATNQRDWIGPWTDVFMLGAVLFEVLYGLAPHEDNTAIDVLEVASVNEWRFPDHVSGDLRPYHEVLKPVIIRALATHPQQRFANAQELADAVRAALEHLESAELASEAIGAFKQVEADEAAAQKARHTSSSVTGIRGPQERYREIARVIAMLEQALRQWPENPAARQYLVEAHLLHAHSSLSAGDLMLAETHLQSLTRLPADARPLDEQLERAQALRRRLEARRSADVRRRRWLVGLQISAVSLAVALLVGALGATFLIRNARDQARTERNHLSRLLIGTASDGIEAELDRLFEPVRGSLNAAADWARAGRLDTDDPQELTSFFLPLIDGFPVVSAIIRADTEGHEYMLQRTDSGWRVRTKRPGQPFSFELLDDDGNVQKTWTEQLDYASHTRPWFRGATRLRADGVLDRPFWTPPYTFYTTKEPGITASMPVTSPSGRELVLGIDVSLGDISAFTTQMPDSEHGKVFVLTEDERVVGLPRSPAFATEAQRDEAVLEPLDRLPEPVTKAALSEWHVRQRAERKPFRFVSEGQVWWSGFRHFDLGPERRLWIGVVLPEADFAVPD